MLRHRLKFASITGLAGWAALSAAAVAQDTARPTFPADAGALNVKDFGAVGDGVHDDTAAFAKALGQSSERAEHWHVRIVAVPAGTYRVTDTIAKRFPDGRYNAGLILVGAGRGKTTIRLADGAAGFQDASHPKSVIYTTGKGFAQAPKDGYALRGEGNDGFSNFIEDLTVDVGHGNPGAIGIDYLANNQGAIRSVTVTGSGATGIAMTRPWVGPALVEDVAIKGFAIGLDVASIDYSVTIEGLTLEGQSRTALRNADNLLALHDLTIRGVPGSAEAAIANTTASGMIVIDGGTIEGSGERAIDNHGFMHLRGLKLTGFSRTFDRSAGPLIDGVYQGDTRLSEAAPRWALKGKSPPAMPDEPVSAWKSVKSFGAAGDGTTDDTAALHAAFASGAHTIYLPFGVYLVRGNVDMPGSVHRLVGMNSTILWVPSDPADRSADDIAKGIFRPHNDETPLVIDKLFFSCPKGRHTAIEAMGKAPLVLRDIVGMGVVFQRNADGGPLFMENISGGFLVRIAGPAPVWGRQIDTEGGGARGGSGNIRIANDGAPLWLLGLKSEGNNTLVANTGGATTDIVGALFAPLGSADLPLFSSPNSRLQATGVEVAFKQGASYATLLDGDDTGRPITAPSLPPRPKTSGVFLPRIVVGR